MSLVAMIKGRGASGFGYGSTAEQVTDGVDLTGKTYLLTGCNSGLGLETLRVLSLRGAHVIAAARTVDKARRAAASVGVEATPVCCELSDPISIRGCVRAVKELGRPLAGIICNAGIMALPKLQQKFGIELQFLTNHIGHFIVVTDLLDTLAEDGRVVVLSSAAHATAPRQGIEFDNLSGERGYSPWRFYGQAKLANLLFARHLAKQLASSRRTVNAVHPGVIQTNLGRHMNPLFRAGMALAKPVFLKSVAQGAATQCYVAAHPQVAGVSGQYFADSNLARSTRSGRDDALAARLWARSEEIVTRIS